VRGHGRQRSRSWRRGSSVGFVGNRWDFTPGTRAHLAHSWRPSGLDELEPMAEACQLGGGWAAGRCFDLWAAVFCRGRCAQRIGFKVHESQFLTTNSRFLTSLGNSAWGSCPALYGHGVGISLGPFPEQRQASLP